MINLGLILARLRSDKLRRQPKRIRLYWLRRQYRDVRREWAEHDDRARALHRLLEELRVAIAAAANE
mgnify:FL=1